MAKIYLINVGANTSHGSKARSPIFSDDTWIYVPFPREHSKKKGEPYPEKALPFVRVGDGIKCHLDPDWCGLTYGDACENRRAAALLEVLKDDILLFWGLLWGTDHDGSIFKSHDKRWYLIGALRVEHIFKNGERTDIDTLPVDIRQRASRNAHVHEGQVKQREGERVFVGSLSHSRRFEKAIDWEVYRDGGLMQRVVKTKDGEKIQWKESPLWNSVTRPCRAILDLDDQRDRTVAIDLATCIGIKNDGFDLIEGS